MNISLKKKATASIFSVISRLGNLLHPNRNMRPILISGSPRGGTTWVAESIAHSVGTKRIIWEPLQEGSYYKHGLGLSCRPVVNENNESNKKYVFFDQLLNAEIADSHTVRLRSSLANMFNLLRNDLLVIKFVRANGVLGYIKRNFDVRKPLIVIRHPCAVVSSQLSMGAWEDHPHVDEEVLLTHSAFNKFSSRDSPLYQRLAVTWCGDVANALKDKEHVHIVFYEDLVINDGAPMWEVFNDWGLVKDFSNYLDGFLKASSTTHHWADHSTKESKLNSWKKRLSKEEVDSILSIVKSLGLDLYDEDGLPSLSAKKLLKNSGVDNKVFTD